MSVLILDDEKIGVISDTHGSFPAWRDALELFGNEVKTIFHAGDVLYHGQSNSIPYGYTSADLMKAINDFAGKGGKVIISEGNCDASVDKMVLVPKMEYYVSAIWRGKKIFMMHGDNYPLFKQTAIDNKVSLAISGHTHIAMLKRENGVIFLNPGSTTIPKGIDSEKSAAIIADDGISVMTLDGKELYFEKWQK